MSNVSDEECIICLENNIDNFQIQKKCDCIFLIHKQCLDNWLKKHNQCPICRKTLNLTLEPIVQENGEIIIYNTDTTNIVISSNNSNIQSEETIIPIRRKLYLKKIFFCIIGFILCISFIIFFL